MKRRIPTSFLLDRGAPKKSGRIQGPPLGADVRIHTDRWGIPRIRAENELDLFTAQGWVHASDRLWQMEAVRRLAFGRLSEIAGRPMLELDHFARISGFPEVTRRAVEGLSGNSRRKMEAYITGINSFIEIHRNKLPLEFRSLDMEPEPWTLADALANLVVNSWYLQTNYLEEVLAVRTMNLVTREQWDAMCPGMSAFDDDPLPEDAYFEKLRGKRIGKFLPATYGFYKEFPVISGASNNWAVSRGPGNLPLVANDPHLGVQLPQIWYACGLETPDKNILGVGMPGFPGIVIGRTPEVSWAFTNVMTDIVDLYIVDVDVKNRSCMVNGRSQPLEVREEVFKLPGGEVEIREILITPHGPLITSLEDDCDAAAAMKWYGTLAEGTIKDETAEGILAFSSVKSVGDMRRNASRLNTIGQNIVAGDTNGDILWQATGSIPLRRNYSGRLPADGSAGHDWKGFVPFDNMPSSRNPEDGRIITANHRTVDAGASIMPTRAWAMPWRYRRIREVLSGMPEFTVGNFAMLQNDSVSLRPAHLLPVLLEGEFSDRRALRLAEILADWDGDCSRNSIACTIFNRIPRLFCENLLRSLLGDHLDLYYVLLPFYPGILESVTADPGVIGLFPREDGSPPVLNEVMEEVLLALHSELTRQLGGNIGKWTWGRWHQLEYRHSGAKDKISSWLLNRGPWPADGDWTTVNVSGYSLLVDPGKATTIPSMRFISSLADRDENILCLPLGQSGRPGNRHYDDFAPLYRRGDYVPFPMDPAKTGRGGKNLVLRGGSGTHGQGQA